MSDSAAISGLMAILAPGVSPASPAAASAASGDFLARLAQLVAGTAAELLPETPAAAPAPTAAVPPSVQQALAMMHPDKAVAPEQQETEEGAEATAEEEAALETADEATAEESDTPLSAWLTPGVLPLPQPTAPAQPGADSDPSAPLAPAVSVMPSRTPLPLPAGVEPRALPENIPFPLNQFTAAPATATSRFSVLDEPPAMPLPAPPTVPAPAPASPFVFTGPVRPISRLETIEAVTAVPPAPRSAFPVMRAMAEAVPPAPLPVPSPALPVSGALEGELLPGVATYQPPWAQLMPAALPEDVTPSPPTVVPAVPVMASPEEIIAPLAAAMAHPRAQGEAEQQGAEQPPAPPAVSIGDASRPVFTVDRPAPELSRLEAQQVIAQVATAVRQHGSGHAHELQVRLDPPELGTVHLQVTARGEEMVAHLQASSPIARDLLEARLPELRERLQEAGLTISSCTVSLTTQQGQGDPRQPWPAALPAAPPGGDVMPAPEPAPVDTPSRPSQGLLDYLA